MTQPLKWIWIVCGWTCIGLGVIGAILPLLPTTPFILLAAYCFSKGSERWHQWLLQNRYFGSMIRDWEDHGVIRKRAKILATVSIIIVFGITLTFVKVHVAIKAILVGIALSVLTFIWTRPSLPQKKGDTLP